MGSASDSAAEQLLVFFIFLGSARPGFAHLIKLFQLLGIQHRAPLIGERLISFALLNALGLRSERAIIHDGIRGRFFLLINGFPFSLLVSAQAEFLRGALHDLTGATGAATVFGLTGRGSRRGFGAQSGSAEQNETNAGDTKLK